MQIYIFDTDHLSLYGRANPFLIARLQETKLKLTTTVINVEEQLRGRLAQISEIKDGENKSVAYQLKRSPLSRQKSIKVKMKSCTDKRQAK